MHLSFWAMANLATLILSSFIHFFINFIIAEENSIVNMYHILILYPSNYVYLC